MAAVNGISKQTARRWGRGFASCAVLAAVLSASSVALAQQRLIMDGDTPISAFAAQRGGISLGQATAMARSRYPGRVVRAESVMIGDRIVYEIRILGDDGRVRTVRVDAQTGSFL
jgi:uncharacterized membrane protein YkoI